MSEDNHSSEKSCFAFWKSSAGERVSAFQTGQLFSQHPKWQSHDLLEYEAELFLEKEYYCSGADHDVDECGGGLIGEDEPPPFLPTIYSEEAVFPEGTEDGAEWSPGQTSSSTSSGVGGTTAGSSESGEIRSASREVVILTENAGARFSQLSLEEDHDVVDDDVEHEEPRNSPVAPQPGGFFYSWSPNQWQALHGSSTAAVLPIAAARPKSAEAPAALTSAAVFPSVFSPLTAKRFERSRAASDSDCPAPPRISPPSPKPGSSRKFFPPRSPRARSQSYSKGSAFSTGVVPATTSSGPRPGSGTSRGAGVAITTPRGVYCACTTKQRCADCVLEGVAARKRVLGSDILSTILGFVLTPFSIGRLRRVNKIFYHYCHQLTVGKLPTRICTFAKNRRIFLTANARKEVEDVFRNSRYAKILPYNIPVIIKLPPEIVEEEHEDAGGAAREDGEDAPLAPADHGVMLADAVEDFYRVRGGISANEFHGAEDGLEGRDNDGPALLGGGHDREEDGALEHFAEGGGLEGRGDGARTILAEDNVDEDVVVLRAGARRGEDAPIRTDEERSSSAVEPTDPDSLIRGLYLFQYQLPVYTTFIPIGRFADRPVIRQPIAFILVRNFVLCLAPDMLSTHEESAVFRRPCIELTVNSGFWRVKKGARVVVH